jgi:hypothetical protein
MAKFGHKQRVIFLILGPGLKKFGASYINGDTLLTNKKIINNAVKMHV